MQVKWLLILKGLELALTCVCVGLHYHSWNAPNIGMLTTGTYVGYLIILAVFGAGYALQAPHHKRIDILYSIIGAALFVASGAVVIDGIYYVPNGQYRRTNMAKASVSVMNGAVFLVDAVLTYLKR